MGSDPLQGGSMATRVITLLIVAACLGVAAAASQQEPVRNPLAGKSDAIAEGQTLFRSECSYCHGLNARGGTRGPDLTSGRSVRGDSDAALFTTISKGVS